MKHECHCGFSEHLRHFKPKKLGLLGAILMILHLLWHVAECLILPALFLGAAQAANHLQHDETINYIELAAPDLYASPNLQDYRVGLFGENTVEVAE